jgi:hypothetical protein
LLNNLSSVPVLCLIEADDFFYTLLENSNNFVLLAFFVLQKSCSHFITTTMVSLNFFCLQKINLQKTERRRRLFFFLPKEKVFIHLINYQRQTKLNLLENFQNTDNYFFVFLFVRESVTFQSLWDSKNVSDSVVSKLTLSKMFLGEGVPPLLSLQGS